MRASVLAVRDGALGFWGALREVFPTTWEQRRWFHKIADVLGALPKSALYHRGWEKSLYAVSVQGISTSRPDYLPQPARRRKEQRMPATVIFAAYGALRGGGQDNTEAAIVTAALQDRLNETSNGVVRIDNANMGEDPAVGVRKHFGAIVEIDGVPRPFACQEGQTIDFT